MREQNLLGDMEESLSPREKWIRSNAVKVFQTGGDHEEPKWKAVSGNYEAVGPTDDEAVERLAQVLWAKKKIKTWNHYDPRRN